MNSCLVRKDQTKMFPSDRGKQEAYITADVLAHLNYASLNHGVSRPSMTRALVVDITLRVGK